MGNALQLEDDFLSFADLVTWTPTTPATPKSESERNHAAESFETLVQAAEKRAEAKAVTKPVSVSFVVFKGPAHVWVNLPRGWTKFSTRTTRVDSAEQERMIEQARIAHPGCDIGVSAKKGWL